MKQQLVQFYDRYHQKNDRHVDVIADDNFTYWYILKTFRQVLPQSLSKRRLLDVGCGVGTLALYFAQRCKTVVGIDVSERAISIAKQAKQALHQTNLTFQQAELRKFTQPFDITTCTEVIEHIADDRQFLKKIVANLKPNGWLLLSTPSRDNLLTKVGYYRSFDQEVGHVRRYSLAEITQLCTQAGLTVRSARVVEGPLRSLLFTTPLGHLIRIIKGPLIPLFHFVDECLVPIFGAADCIVVAQKSKS